MAGEAVSLGSLLKQHRLTAGLSQEALAERSGVSLRAISGLEREPSRAAYPATIKLLADALGLSEDDRVALENTVVRRRRPRAGSEGQPGSVRAAGATPLVTAGEAGALSGLRVEPATILDREAELETLGQFLLGDKVRLLTLTGPAGVGKSRLAAEVDSRTAGHYPQGVYFVDLSTVRDVDLVLPAIAGSLGLPNASGNTLMARLQEYLQNRTLLLVLDSFEYVRSAAGILAELLTTCPNLTLMVTSREPLHLRAEQVFQVAPLALPALHPFPSLPDLARVASVALFVERARAISSEFVLTAEDAPAVAEICVRLDGLPLAIEQAAARISLLSPQMIRDRLVRPLSLLRWAARDVPERQQTLRGAIGWSYDLLDEGERALFRRLSVFVGGFTLEAAEAVGASVPEPAIDVLEAMASLVESSLVTHDGGTEGGRRYYLLESMREYALEQLAINGEDEAARQAHALYMLELAERAAPALEGREQQVWFLVLEQERRNLGSAIRWLLGRGEGTLAMRLATALGNFWWRQGYLVEGNAALREALEKTRDVEPKRRAKALNALAVILISLGEETRARTMFDEVLALARSADDPEEIARALTNFGLLAFETEDYVSGARIFREARAGWAALGNGRGEAMVCCRLGVMMLFAGDLDQGEDLLIQAEQGYRAVGDDRGARPAQAWLGWAAAERGDMPRAVALLGPLLETGALLEDPTLLYLCSFLLICLRGSPWDAGQVARLLGAQESYCNFKGFWLTSWCRSRWAGAISALQRRLSPAAYEGAIVEGRRLSSTQMLWLMHDMVAVLAPASPPAQEKSL